MRCGEPLDISSSKMNSKSTSSHANGSVDNIDAPLTAVDTLQTAKPTGNETTRHHAHTYRWPTGHDGRHASLEVSAESTTSGELPTFRYRASLEQSAAADPHGPFAPDWQPVPQSAFVYRHAHIALAFEDPELRVPPHAHVFARESFMDEMASEMSLDPVALRLRHLDRSQDAGAREVIRTVTERAAWGHKEQLETGSFWLKGRGFAMDGCRGGTDEHSSSSGRDDAPGWSAWIVDIDVHRQTGDVTVRRVVAGY